MVDFGPEKFTVFGSTGFIGKNFVRYLRNRGHWVVTPRRNPDTETISCGGDLGHVVFAVGVTGDFRWRPFETVEAHVSRLAQLISVSKFQSWLVLSSARMYDAVPTGAPVNEEALFLVRPSADSLYDLSKLLGEALCLSLPSDNVRIARLSNVYGPGQSKNTFLGAIISELALNNTVQIQEDSKSTKDYVSIDDVCVALEYIALRGKHRLYNVAGGQAISHGELANALEYVSRGRVDFAPAGAIRRLPAIDITRAREEFGFCPRYLIDDLDRFFV